MADHAPSFNRTTMELKPTPNRANPKEGVAFNRTTMELKPIKDKEIKRDLETFNRTTMELKLISRIRKCCDVLLLIEPLWN